MSVSSYQSDIARLTRDIADCDRDAGREQEKIARLTSDIASVERSITSTTSTGTVQSKTNQIASKRRDLAAAHKKLSEINTKKSNKEADLGRKRQSLNTAMQQEARTREQQEKRQREEQLRHTREVTREMERQRQVQYELAPLPEFLDPRSLPEKIKVLFLAANPVDQQQLRLDVEVRGIEEKIRASEHRDSVALTSRWAVRTTDLLQHLNEHLPHVIHFSGHGSSDSDIIFEGPDGRSKFVTKEAIVQVMNTAAENIRLVVFNSCFSSGQAEAVTEHVEAAIGMNTAIGDEAAQVFAAQFYSAIGFGKSVQVAFGQAKAALMLEGIPEEDTPELFTRDGVDAANIYLVRPERPDPIALVRSPTSIMPGLKPSDVAVLKAACESKAKELGDYVTVSELANVLSPENLTEEDVEESISILTGRGFLKDIGSMRHYVSVTSLGFDKYATVFLPEYADVTRQVAEAVLNGKNGTTNSTDEISAALGIERKLVERILDVFDDRGFVKLVRFMGGSSRVLHHDPSLKRWLEHQK